MKVAYEETIGELRRQFDTDLQKLKDEHVAELDDEKNATKSVVCVEIVYFF